MSRHQELIDWLRAYDWHGAPEGDKLIPALQESASLIELLDLIATGKSPCGHWGSYAYTPDGKGAQIECMQCRAEKAEAQLAERTEAFSKAINENDAALVRQAKKAEAAARQLCDRCSLNPARICAGCHEIAVNPDPTQAEDPHVDRLVALINQSLRGGGCSNCGGLPHSTTCRVGRLWEAFLSSKWIAAAMAMPPGTGEAAPVDLGDFKPAPSDICSCGHRRDKHRARALICSGHVGRGRCYCDGFIFKRKAKR